MQGVLGKKKPEEASLLDADKKEATPAIRPALSMTEGPMQLRDERQETGQHEREGRIKAGASIGGQPINESEQVEKMGRMSYEKSVEVELAALKKGQKKTPKKAPQKKKKPRWGWKMDTEPPPSRD